MAEPIFVNPNSYSNITVIMDKLKEALLIGNERQWSFIGWDGLPYVIANRLIDSDPVKYQWVAMSYGLGHLYMNQIKTFFSVCKSIFLEELARDVLHFQMPNALNHFFRCSDTHKSYQALEVLLYGTTCDMLHSYVKQCDSEPSVEGFLSFNPNNTYHMIRQLVLNYALAIFISKKEIAAIMFKFKMLVVINFRTFLWFRSPHLPRNRVLQSVTKSYYAKRNKRVTR